MISLAQMALTTPQFTPFAKERWCDRKDKNDKKCDKTVLIQYHENGIILKDENTVIFRFTKNLQAVEMKQ